MKDKWFNPFLATGSTQATIDEFNNDNFDHAGLGFLGGAGINASMFHGRPIASATAARHAALGQRLEEGQRRLVCAFDERRHARQLLPARENYLDLDPTYTDAYGLPLIRMNFDWRDNELKMSRYIAGKQAEIAKAINADIVAPASTLHDAIRRARLSEHAHHRRHDHGRGPATSVVSPHLQHWDAQNLFVVGASVYRAQLRLQPDWSARGAGSARRRRHGRVHATPAVLG